MHCKIFQRKSIPFLCLFAVFFLLAYPAVAGPRLSEGLIVFHSLTCHKCIQIKNEIIPVIEKEFKGLLDIEYRDIGDLANYKLFLGLKDEFAPDLSVVWPVFFLKGRLLNGSEVTLANLKSFVIQGMGEDFNRKFNHREVDLVAYFRSFTPFAISAAGLIDGINPCAFTVIVFFMSFLALQGYRRKSLVVVGIFFILAVWITYILIGLGLFGFFYRMNSFWSLVRTINLSVGVFSIILGCLAVRDFLIFRSTGDTEKMLLKLPKAVKDQIHRLIGMHYRKPRDGASALSERHTSGLVISALVTGFLVSLLEAVCTGQTYLPTITFILKTTPLKPQALFYLLLYNFMFIVPLLVVFAMSLFGATSAHFSGFMRKHFLAIKALMAVLFFLLGIFLIWR